MTQALTSGSVAGTMSALGMLPRRPMPSQAGRLVGPKRAQIAPNFSPIVGLAAGAEMVWPGLGASPPHSRVPFTLAASGFENRVTRVRPKDPCPHVAGRELDESD